MEAVGQEATARTDGVGKEQEPLLRPARELELGKGQQASGTWNTDDTDEDLDFVMLMRSNNRMLVSLVMYIVPPIFILQNWKYASKPKSERP